MSIFKITEELQAISEAILEGISDEELEELIRLESEDKEALGEKLKNYARLILQEKNDIEACKKEIERLSDRAKQKDRLIDRLKKAMVFAMDATEIQKVEDELFTISLRNNPARLEVIEEEIIPDQFRRPNLKFEAGELKLEDRWELEAKYKDLRIEESIDKKKLQSWYKETGEIVQGTSLKKEKSLQIK